MPSVSARKATATLEAFIARGDARVWSLWASLPDGLDRSLVARAMSAAMTDGHSARAVGRRLNDSYFDLFAAELARHPTWPETIATMTVPAEQRRAYLGELYRKMRLVQNGVGSEKQRRIAEFAFDPLFVNALIAIVGSGTKLDFNEDASFLGVLLEAATPEALDVVLPRVLAAVKEKGEQLDLLRGLLKRRRAPALEALRALLDDSAAQRPGARARELWANAVVLPATKKPLLRWSWSSLAVGADRSIQLSVDFDVDRWFAIRVLDQDRATVISANGVEHDELRLPALTDFLVLPRWVGSAKAKLGGTWDAGTCGWPRPSVSCRNAIERWLDPARGR